MLCGPFLRAIGRMQLRFWGWTLEGQLPEDKKILLIAAPHTSNWDWVIGVAALLALGIKITYIAKHSLFKGPLGLGSSCHRRCADKQKSCGKYG